MWKKHFEVFHGKNFIIFRWVFNTQSNIYDKAFFAKIDNSFYLAANRFRKKRSIVDVRLGSKYASDLYVLMMKLLPAVFVTKQAKKPSNICVAYFHRLEINPFYAIASFYTFLSHQKSSGFLMFSGGIERDQWHEIGWYGDL